VPGKRDQESLQPFEFSNLLGRDASKAVTPREAAHIADNPRDAKR
jgi:hypothetical protein